MSEIVFVVNMDPKEIKILLGNGVEVNLYLGDFSQLTAWKKISNPINKLTFSEFYECIKKGESAKFDWDIIDGSGNFRYDNIDNILTINSEKYLIGCSIKLPLTSQIVAELGKLLPVNPTSLLYT